MLPEPAHVAALCTLAAHPDPETQAQADELCLVLPLPVRVLAAEQLADQGHLAAAARVAWPDAPAEREAVLWALAMELVEAVLPRWEAAMPGATAPRELLLACRAGSDTPRRPVMLRALERATRAALATVPARDVRAAGAAALALCAPDGARAAQDALALAGVASQDAEATARWAGSRLRRHLQARAALPPEARRALAAAFGAALDALALDRAALLLAPGCAWEVRGTTYRGPEAALAAYREGVVQARARLAGVTSCTTLLAEGADPTGEVIWLACRDVLEDAAGRSHTFQARLRLSVEASGRIWRLQHVDLPGEVERLRRFLAAGVPLRR